MAHLLDQRRVSENTVRAYESDLRQFGEFLAARDDTFPLSFLPTTE
ncbi:MAG: site-specific integrase [Okeania sp. SIO4D6]|nr:site-specific integrase [Okeania sp. SIO4D6]